MPSSALHVALPATLPLQLGPGQALQVPNDDWHPKLQKSSVVPQKPFWELEAEVGMLVV